MPLKDDLLRKGYFPENLPPAFSSGLIADYFQTHVPNGYLSRGKNAVRAASYNASKRGMTRRVFSAIFKTLARCNMHGRPLLRRERNGRFYERTHSH